MTIIKNTDDHKGGNKNLRELARLTLLNILSVQGVIYTHYKNKQLKGKRQMNKYKQATKFMRSGCQKDRSHTPHYVIITDKGFIQCPFGLFFISKKEAKEYANENVNNYYEIYKDYFVE